VLPLVAGLFILVEGLNRTGALPALARLLKEAATASPQSTSWIAGIAAALASNLLNNLPMGLIAATTSQAAQVPAHVTGAIPIGVDLGTQSFGDRLASHHPVADRAAARGRAKLGLLVMPPALLLSLCALSAVSP
jgi:arsenical pump membrane protein